MGSSAVVYFVASILTELVKRHLVKLFWLLAAVLAILKRPFAVFKAIFAENPKNLFHKKMSASKKLTVSFVTSYSLPFFWFKRIRKKIRAYLGEFVQKSLVTLTVTT